jgi:hypothetical protein
MHSNSDWELFVTLRKQKNKEMKRPQLCSHGMPTRLPHCGGGAWIWQPGGQQKQRATRSGSMPANSAPVCESIRAADGTGNRVGGNYNNA